MSSFRSQAFAAPAISRADVMEIERVRSKPKLMQSKAQVIRRALEEMEDRVFWAEVGEAFARDAADPAEVARQRAEIEPRERASATDFREEKW